MTAVETPQPVIQELDPLEIARVCELFETVFGQAISPAIWHWKYHQGPRLGSVNLIAQDRDGTLLGHAGASIFPGTLRGTPIAMAQVCDVMVRPAARGNLNPNNVYPRLLRALQQTVATRFRAPFAYGFAGKKQVALGTRMGFYRAIHPYCPSYYTPAPSNRWTAHWWQWQVKTIDWDTARLDKICAQHQALQNQPAVLRSGAYLAWRYQNHPVHSYQLQVVRRRLLDCGWLITRAMPNGDICIVDSLLPARAQPPDWLAPLARALTKTSPKLPRLYGWQQQSDSNPSAEPIIACEVKLAHWHTDRPSPNFQPGDTDVF